MIDPDFDFNAPILGDLEIAVLEHAWRAQETTAKRVQSALRPHRNIALGTVQSTVTDPAWQNVAIEGYVFVAFCFWVFCFGISRYSQNLERKLDTGHKT